MLLYKAEFSTQKHITLQVLIGTRTEHKLFFQTFRAPPGHPGKIPGYPAKKFGFPGFRRTYQTFWPPHPFTRKTPTPPEDIWTKKFGFGFLFRPSLKAHSSQKRRNKKPHGGTMRNPLRFVFLKLRLKFGDKFGESLGGSHAPPSFWEVPGLPRKYPELPRKFFGDFPGSSLTVELNSNPEVPRKFPKLPRKSAPFSGKPDTLS